MEAISLSGKKRFTAIVVSIMLVLAMCLPYLISPKGVHAANDEKVVLGYYASWAPPGDSFDPNKITHLNYSFGDICWDGEHGNPNNEEIAEGEQKVWPCTDLDGETNTSLDNGTIVMYEPEVDLVELERVAALKEENPGLKTLLSIGGWTLSHNLSDVAADEDARQTLAESALAFIEEFEMDGLDVDWEWPGYEGHPGNAISSEDGENYIKLLQTIRDVFDDAGKEEYLVTIAGAQTWTFDEHNDLAAIGEIVDYAAIMAYDTNGTWSGLTGHNAPVYPDPLEEELRGWASGSAEGACNMYVWQGIPAEKVVLGVPFYGQAWGGCNEADDGAYQSDRGAYQDCAAGPTDLESTGYNYIKTIVNQEGYKYYWDNVAKVPDLYNETTRQFISYDNVESLQYKVNLVKEKALGGIMIWDLATDDEEWNLLKTVSHGLGVSSDEPTPDPEQPAFDLSPLEDLIEEAKAISNEDKTYTTNSFDRLQKAIIKAEAAVETIDSDEGVVKAVEDLQATIDGLEEEEDETLLDLTALKELIETAKKISNDDETYTEDSFAGLQLAIEAAEVALQKVETEEDLQAELANLQAAIDGLEKAEIVEGVDLTKLLDLIAKAKKILNDDEKYTTASYGKLQTAIGEAESAVEGITTEEELNEEIASLQAAIDGLEEITVIIEEGPEKDESTKEEGKELPKTATNTFNLLIIGAIVLFLGGIVLTLTRRKAMSK